MSATSKRQRAGGSGEAALIWIGIAIIVGAVGSVWVALMAGSQIDHVNASLPADPFTLFFGVLRGAYVWPTASTVVLIAALVLELSLAVALVVLFARRHASGSRVDGAAPHMGRGRDVDALTAQAIAKRGNVAVTGWPGVKIGVSVVGNRPLYGSPEDMHVDIWGPRTGKTTSRAIPAVLQAPGAVLTTSNKRDVLDATRAARSEKGHVWAFDPQQIAREDASWWWNPLSYVTDDTRAARLAAHFASGSRQADSRVDPYFDNAGQDLLAGFLLAAALDHRAVTQAFTWTTMPGEDEPVSILRRAGYEQLADAVAGQVHGENRRRDSVYGTAAQMASCLKVRSIASWVTARTGGDHRRQFVPDDFVRSTDTLYSLSKEGRGTAGPLVTALTAATVEAAEELATASPAGRLAVPLLGVLDEAANVCRWHDLPDLYSHYGSRGIVLMTILQSWSQGVEVWGREGMRKLWSSANVAVYGGGVKEPEFLEELSRMIGDYDRAARTTNVGRNNRSSSVQMVRERTLDVADLAALPRGRAVLFASGAPATLVRTLPHVATPHNGETRFAKP